MAALQNAAQPQTARNIRKQRTMKTRRSIRSRIAVPALAAALLPLLPGPAPALPVLRILSAGEKAVDKILELAARVSKRSVGPAAKRAVRPAVEQAVSKNGVRAVRSAVRNGGWDLLEAGAKHGEDIMAMAARVPEAARVLAAHPQRLSALARRYGDDVLRLEAARPGLTQIMRREIPENSLQTLFRYGGRHPNQVAQLTAVAQHIPDPKIRAELIAAFIRTQNKPRFLARLLDRVTWRKILAGGLSASAIIAAAEAGNGVADAARKITPDRFEHIFIAAAIAFALTLLLGAALLFRRRPGLLLQTLRFTIRRPMTALARAGLLLAAILIGGGILFGAPKAIVWGIACVLPDAALRLLRRRRRPAPASTAPASPGPLPPSQPNPRPKPGHPKFAVGPQQPNPSKPAGK